MKLFIFFLFVFSGTYSMADEFDKKMKNLESKFVKKNGSLKAFKQMKCFIERYKNRKFHTKPADNMADRCNQERTIAVENDEVFVIIDYTLKSNNPRFFLFDLESNKVKAYHVSHGRYGNTARSNTKISYNPKRNSILQALFFSNSLGSNASSGGFYLTGQEYMGNYGRSMVLHGLEGDINDNACRRATVVHPSSKVTTSATKIMSSGCPMLSRSQIDEVINETKEGSLFYIYTPAEAKQVDGECGRNLL